MATKLPAPAPSRQFGYTCKVWIAYQLEKTELGGVYFSWFSLELNPLTNGDSSNPIELYRMIDTL